MYPHLQYCNVVWGNCTLTLSNILLRSQKRAVRNISHEAYDAHTLLLFKNLKILKINEINKLEVVKFVKKELNKPNSKFFTFRQNQHNMNLRNFNNMNVNLPFCRTERAKRFVKYHGAKIWNDLPLFLKQKRNPVTFKIHTKKYFLSQY